MMNGIKTRADGEYCAHCSSRVSKYYDFCPKCGNALTGNGMQLREQQIKRIQLDVLDELALAIKDEEALRYILNKVKSL